MKRVLLKTKIMKKHLANMEFQVDRYVTFIEDVAGGWHERGTASSSQQ